MTEGTPDPFEPVPPVDPADSSPLGENPPRRGWWARLRARWAGVPLVTRLVGIVTVLLALGLVLAGVTSGTLLEGTLTNQVDTKLQTQAEGLAKGTPFAIDQRFGDGNAPSDYYVRVQDTSETIAVSLSDSAAARYGVPLVPDLTAEQADRIRDEPFTVRSTESGSPWRAVAYPLTNGGSIVLALPLGDIHSTIQHMALVLVLSGVGILLLGAVGGVWAVRRSLRPLREIEATAAAIAAGDLSQRVPASSEHTEVGRLSAALNGMLTQIERAFDVQTASEVRMRRFVADASHELRTPLATIRGYGELYRMGALTTTDQVEDTMQRIESSATRMGALVEDLLALARMDDGRPMRLAPVDLTVLAADAVSDLHALDPSRSVRLEPLRAGEPGGVCEVLGEESRLRQVLANLVGNAVTHTPPGTAVEIAVGLTDAHGVLEVRDHGPGIDPEHAARVFERFYRVDASRGRDSGGAGLGMAIVAAIVDAHHGTVSLQQTPGGGTTVRVTLPVPATSEPSTPQSASPPVSTPSRPAAPTRQRPPARTQSPVQDDADSGARLRSEG
ncbi:cell wall metabolism sensor histidine kinase WalK [Cellulomonas sp. URHD0024]|uniref:sensor histidine kinase n=1 Tax=Cellulomonas sp. URHD0024 TaxID=1302620 RepID=UPI0009DC1665|nr:HAMP domain-containing sensor histidine kinase [Cellulomonas sp. URHD0024]